MRTHSSVFEVIDDSKKNVASKTISISREARSNQRRLLTAFGSTSDSDLLKFNILKVRLRVFVAVSQTGYGGP